MFYIARDRFNDLSHIICLHYNDYIIMTLTVIERLYYYDINSCNLINEILYVAIGIASNDNILYYMLYTSE